MVEHAVEAIKRSVGESGKFTIFLGAGASIPAGIPSAHGVMLRASKEFLGAGDIDSDALYSWLRTQEYFIEDEPYASVLDAALPSQGDRVEFFERLIRGCSPSTAHNCIAALIQQGRVLAVLTTNFDRLMEYAIVKTCRHMPCVTLAGMTMDYDAIPLSRGKVLKLHGDYLYGNIKNFRHELYSMTQSTTEKIKYAAGVGPMVVAGYSGGDTSVMEILSSVACEEHAFEGGIHWLQLKGTQPHPDVVSLIELTRSKGSRLLEVEDCDQMFASLSVELEGIEGCGSSTLAQDAHRIVIPEEQLSEFVGARLDECCSAEFLSQYRRRMDLMGFGSLCSELDLLIAAYLENQEIPTNVGQLVDRHIDLVAGASLPGPTGKNAVEPTRGRLEDIASLGLVDQNDEGSAEESRAIIKHFVKAVDLVHKDMTDEDINEFLSSNESYECLRLYVGLVPDATSIVHSAINLSVDLPGIHGFVEPWEIRFYRAAALVGAANYVDQGMVERTIDLCLVDLDKPDAMSTHAVRTMVAIGSKASEALTAYVLDSLNSEESRRCAAKALGGIGTGRVIELLAQASNNCSCRVRDFIVYALGRTGNPKAIPVVREIAHGAEGETRDLADEALALLTERTESYESTGEIKLHFDHETNRKVLFEHCPELEGLFFSENTKRMYTEQRSAENIVKSLEMMGWPSDLKKLISAGQRLRNTGQYHEAEILTWECLKRYPMIHHIYHDLAMIYSRQGRHSRARRYYTYAMIFDPDYVDFYNDFAVAMLELSNWEAARYLLTRAILLNMKNYRPWFNLIAVNCCGTKSDNTELNEQVDMPDGGQIRTYAFSMGDDARRRDIEICLRQVLHLCPTHPIAGNMYTKLFGTKCAVPLEAPDLQELVSVLHLGERELGKAIEDKDWPKEAVKVFQRAEELRYKGAMSEAIREMESASRIHPTSPDISLTLGLLLSSTGENQRAMNVLEQALKRFPWHRELSLTYSGVLRDTGKHREAIVAAQRGIAADCMAPGSWLTLCRAYVKSDKLPQARDALKEALRLCKPWSWELFSAFELCKELDVSHPRVW